MGVTNCYISADKHKTLIFIGLVQTQLKYEVLPPPAMMYIDTPEMINSYINRVIKSRRTKWAGHVARMENRRGAYRVLVGRPEGKRPTVRSRRK
jgi:hypothetical protein